MVCCDEAQTVTSYPRDYGVDEVVNINFILKFQGDDFRVFGRLVGSLREERRITDDLE
jgi:hypothetical protein